MAQDPLMALWAQAHEDRPCFFCKAVTQHFWVLRLRMTEQGQKINQYFKICKACGIKVQQIAPIPAKVRDLLLSKNANLQ